MDLLRPAVVYRIWCEMMSCWCQITSSKNPINICSYGKDLKTCFVRQSVLRWKCMNLFIMRHPQSRSHMDTPLHNRCGMCQRGYAFGHLCTFSFLHNGACRCSPASVSSWCLLFYIRGSQSLHSKVRMGIIINVKRSDNNCHYKTCFYKHAYYFI